ncbi:hypothetical protein ACOME3_001062 [Neoechinorhynchus agilis]
MEFTNGSTEHLDVETESVSADTEFQADERSTNLPILEIPSIAIDIVNANKKILDCVDKALLNCSSEQFCTEKPRSQKRMRSIIEPPPIRKIKLNNKVALNQFLHAIKLVCTKKPSSWKRDVVYNVLMDAMQMQNCNLGYKLPSQDLRDVLKRISMGLCSKIDESGFERTNSVDISMRLVLNVLIVPNLSPDIISEDVFELIFKFSSMLYSEDRASEQSQINQDSVAIIDEMSRAIEVFNSPKHVAIAVARAAMHYTGFRCRFL